MVLKEKTWKERFSRLSWHLEIKTSWLLGWEMVVMEGRVIPADRRGSCCFLLGIVTVAFHGASHAGITNKLSLSVLKNHPVVGGEGCVDL